MLPSLPTSAALCGVQCGCLALGWRANKAPSVVHRHPEAQPPLNLPHSKQPAGAAAARGGAVPPQRLHKALWQAHAEPGEHHGLHAVQPRRRQLAAASGYDTAVAACQRLALHPGHQVSAGHQEIL